MSVNLEQLPTETRAWIVEHAAARGTSPEVEAFLLIERAVAERRRREELVSRIDAARPVLSRGWLTERDIEEAIDWGRE